jgi:hypothetical protein
MAKPSVTRQPTTGDTSVFEFRNGARTAETLQGGLLELRPQEDGTLRVDLYRLDPRVIVNVSADPGNEHGSALQVISRAMVAARNENPDATEVDYLKAAINAAMLALHS